MQTKEIERAVERLSESKSIFPTIDVLTSDLDVLLECARLVLAAEMLVEKKTDGHCLNCGADDGLHQAETDLCPRFGREAPVGKKQEWEETTFDDGRLTASAYNAALLDCRLHLAKVCAGLSKGRIAEIICYHMEGAGDQETAATEIVRIFRKELLGGNHE